MPAIDPNILDRALSLLGELMEARRCPEQWFVVCGGSALLALGLVKRTTTRDVDILAKVERENLVTPKPLPDWLLSAATEVERQLGLPRNWLNAEVAEESIFACGFPPGLQERLTERSYGSRLRIGFISRRDQIFLKLHAAVDRDGGRHLQDLMDLNPTENELKDAAEWTRMQNPSEGFKMLLQQMLKSLGHGKIADQV